MKRCTELLSAFFIGHFALLLSFEYAKLLHFVFSLALCAVWCVVVWSGEMVKRTWSKKRVNVVQRRALLCVPVFVLLNKNHVKGNPAQVAATSKLLGFADRIGENPMAAAAIGATAYPLTFHIHTTRRMPVTYEFHC
jgi:hypothetical protein